MAQGGTRGKRTEKQDECDAVQDQNVRDVSNARVTEKFHLLLRGAEEEESGSVEQLSLC